mgnify:CR=1 FL=1
MDVIGALLQRVGTYSGHGINHEDEPFHAELEVTRLVDGKGVTMRFRAQAIDGTLMHDERTWVAPDGPAIFMWSIHSNGAGVRKRDQRNGATVAAADRTLVFGYGDPAASHTYREEVAIDLWPDGSISYRYAWGLPGAPLASRSSVRMRPD